MVNHRVKKVKDVQYSLILLSLLTFSCGGRFFPSPEKTQSAHQDGKKSQPQTEERFVPPDYSVPSMLGKSPLNFDDMRQATGVLQYHQKGYRGKDVVVAILDNGFAGLDKVKGVTLPPSTRIEPWAEGDMAETFHGTKMAELVYGMATGLERFDAQRLGPEIKLFVTNGPFNNLKNAVENLIRLKMEQPNKKIIVLYAQVWEYGGNLDGTGYINELIKKATASGLLWVNASGNIGNSTYSDKVTLTDSRQLALPGDGNTLKVVVPYDQTKVKFVLAWSDFQSSYTDYRTPWDLNMSLLDSEMKPLGKAELIQDGEDHQGKDGFSRHAREQMIAKLDKGTYYIKASSRTDNFKKDADFWIVASGPGVTIEQESPKKVVMAPAGLSSVITVGAHDIAYSSAQVKDGKEVKPDLFCPSQIFFDEDRIEGTSTASAVCVGALSTYWGSRRIFDLRLMLDQLRRNDKSLLLPPLGL